jgi:hydrophobe/amphiphile efflux-3 (HAE3) family protein
MLDKLGRIIERKPWLVIGIVLMVTIGFSTLIPYLEMETSTEDFMPDNEIVTASQRISEYFGQTGEMLMVLVEKENAQNILTPKALKEQYQLIKNIEQYEEVDNIVSITSFIDAICQLEFGKTLINCTDDQIQIALNDLMQDPENNEIQMLNNPDPNENPDYNPYPRLKKGENIDSIDLKNFHIQTTNNSFIFSIEVYDISELENNLTIPHKKINVIEWYIGFENKIKPEGMPDIEYTIAAHIEPSESVWDVGAGFLKNIKQLINNIFQQKLKKSYTTEVYLWIKQNNQEFSFPILLETGEITFNENNDKIIIEVSRQELGNFGIAPKFGSFEMPAKIMNTSAGVRIFQNPMFNKPWSQITMNISYLQKTIEKIQNRPIANAISSKILGRYDNFSWENFDELFSILTDGDMAKDSMSLKDLDSLWETLDTSPDEGYSERELLIKPYFLQDLKTATVTLLSNDYEHDSNVKTLIMIVLNTSSNGASSFMNTGSSDSSKKIADLLIDDDMELKQIQIKVTGSAMISDEINEVTEKANMIIMPGIFIVICIILLIMFKRVSYMLLPLASLGISIIWLFGTMVLLGISFNTMMIAMVPILMGLGVDYSVHLFHNYRTELGKGKKPGEAIISALKDVGMAMILATITTVIAFLSFLSASIPPLRDFGLLIGLGIVYTLITALTFQTATRYILDRNKIIKISSEKKRFSLKNMMEKISNIVLNRAKIIQLFIIGISVIMLSGALQVDTTFDMNDFLPEENRAMELIVDISEIFPSSSESQEYILLEGNVASIDVLKGISETYENFRDDKYITKIPSGDPKELSILSIIRKAVNDNTSIRPEFNLNINGIPESNSDVKRLYDYLYTHENYMLETQSVLHKSNDNFDATIIRIYTSIDVSESSELDTNRQMEILYNDLKEDKVSYGDVDSVVTGELSSTYTIMGSMTNSQIISTAISVLLAAIVLIIVYRNPILGLISIIPVVVSVLWIIGSVYFIGYSFNIMTVMVTSITIGIGIDFSIHITERFRLTADKTGDVCKAVSETVSHTGGALFIAALTTAAGFAMMILAPIPPEQQFGIVTSLTIVYSYLTSIFVLPPILKIWGKWRKRRKGYIISPKKPE